MNGFFKIGIVNKGINKKINNKEKISVMISNYNSQETIERTFYSIIKSVNNAEVIFVDDYSKDNSLRILKNLIEKNKKITKKKKLNFKIFKLKKHLGVGAVRNRCLKESSESLLLFMDSDVVLNKKVVEEMIKNSKDYDILFPNIIFPNKKKMYPIFEHEKEYPLISTCFLIKKTSLNKLNYYFDENYKSGIEDVDFFIRCNYYGLKAKHLSNVHAIHLFKERTNCEERFYYEIRGIVYALRKLKIILKKTKLKHCIKIKTLIKHFICAVFNFNWSDWASYDRDSSLISKLSLLFKKHSRISSRGSLYLIKLYFKALFEGLKLKIDNDRK
ncbi:MAG: glycosyltransferase family 2 protein [Candidatus Woesearchaeota archaeon]